MEIEEPLSEQTLVECWRFEEFLRAGYPPPVAEALAARSDVDLHRAIALVREKGCPTALAGRILL